MEANKATRRRFLTTSSLSLGSCFWMLSRGARAALQNATLSQHRQRPYLLTSAGELPELKEKLSKEPSNRIYRNYTRGVEDGKSRSVEPLILFAVMTGDTSAMEAAGKSFVRSLRRYVRHGEIVLTGQIHSGHHPRPGATGPRYDFSGVRYAHRLLHQYDLIAGFGVLSDEEDKEFRDHIFWVLGRYMSPEIRAINSRHPDRIHNFHVDNITVIATAALTFPDHPDAASWLEYGLTDFAWQMEHGVKDGAWHETPRYQGALLRSVIPLAYALRRNANVDLFKNEGLRGMLDWFVRCQTPRDRVYGAWLMDGNAVGTNGPETMAYVREAVSAMPAIGDALWVNYWFATLAMAAPAYADSDPDFAGRLMWGWDRAGGPYAPESSLLLKPLILIDPSIKAIPQQLGSEGMLDAGYAILRSGYDTPDEKYFIFTCGRRRREHWAEHNHKDQNSFSLFAHGVPLALDAATGSYGSTDQSLWHKATISHNTVMFGGRDQDLLDGEIIRFVSTDGADYVVGDASEAASTMDTGMVMQYYRHVLFVKPDYFVVWDYIRSGVPAEWLLHSPAQEIRKNEHSLEFLTPWDVQLDVHVLLPKGPMDVWEGEGRYSNWGTPTQRGAPPFCYQKYVKIRNEPAQDFLTILYPHKSGDKGLTVRLVGTEEHVIQVRLGRQTDYVMVFPVEKDYENDEKGIAMSGRVGLVRTGRGDDTLILVDGTRLRYKGQEVRNSVSDRP